MLLAAVVGIATAAFLVGRGLRSPAQQLAHSAAPRPSLITAPVQLTRAQTSVVLRGTLVYAGSVTVAAPSLGGELPVVTAAPLRVGAEVSSDTVIAAVAGHPVIVLSGSVPAYRTMVYGDSGVDVSEVQHAVQALGLSIADDPAGDYGVGTAAAVAKLYRDHGFAPVTAAASVPTAGAHGKTIRRVTTLATVPLGEVVFLHSLPAQVIAAAGAGTQLKSSDSAVARLGSGQIALTAAVDSNTAHLTRVGARGRARSDLSSASFAVRVSDVAEAHHASQTIGAPQYNVRFVPVRASAARALVGQNLAIHIRIGATASRRWVVPVAAVVTAADGRSSVTILDHARRISVPVHAGISYAGHQVIVPTGRRLHPGEQVVVGVAGS
jgi:peptidoglycan hydrolase-like protein with peptidoglycan-binding domain